MTQVFDSTGPIELTKKVVIVIFLAILERYIDIFCFNPFMTEADII